MRRGSEVNIFNVDYCERGNQNQIYQRRREATTKEVQTPTRVVIIPSLWRLQVLQVLLLLFGVFLVELLFVHLD